MPLDNQPNRTYAFRNRLIGAKVMYTGDPSRCSSCNRSNAILTGPRYQYGRRLIDMKLGQLACCNNIQDCGCATTQNNPA